ncbi:MAG: hypothetical protein P4L46_13735 [Fimbriimonas sp.]|nr:hypothetical protein [Fimbriimonas sp.]
MNQDKAREFFSAYYEGILEGGLKHSFEQSLRSDAVLQADFAAFTETIRELDALKDEEIEIPIFLSDRIASRLEEAQNKQRRGLPVWLGWVGGLTLTGVAAVLILVAAPRLRSSASVDQAGITGASNLDQIQFKVDGARVIVRYQPSSAKTIVVSAPSTGKEIQRFNLSNQRLESPIENSLAKAVIFKIEALGDKSASLIALPGRSIETAKSGSGSVQDLAVALAGHYRVPVEVEAVDVTHRVSWTFASADARSAANQALESEGFSVDQRSDGLIEILDR